MKQITNKTILKQEIGQGKCKEYGCGNSECIFECLNPKKIFKTYQPVEVDGVVYWIDYYTQKGDFWCIDIDKKIFKDQTHFPISIGQRLIVAQSQSILEGIPVVSLDSYVEITVKNYVQELIDCKSVKEYERTWISAICHQLLQSNPNQYTQKDIEKTTELARETISSNEAGICDKYTELGILQQINSISVIEVDEQFNIISYE